MGGVQPASLRTNAGAARHFFSRRIRRWLGRFIISADDGDEFALPAMGTHDGRAKFVTPNPKIGAYSRGYGFAVTTAGMPTVPFSGVFRDEPPTRT